MSWVLICISPQLNIVFSPKHKLVMSLWATGNKPAICAAAYSTIHNYIHMYICNTCHTVCPVYQLRPLIIEPKSSSFVKVCMNSILFETVRLYTATRKINMVVVRASKAWATLAPFKLEAWSFLTVVLLESYAFLCIVRCAEDIK
jgi:hypothetical protein